MNANHQASVVRLYNNGDSPRGGLKFFISARQARHLGLQPGQLYDLRRHGSTQLDLIPVELAVEAAEGTTAWVQELDHFTPTWRNRGTVAAWFHATQACATDNSHGQHVMRTRLGASLAAGLKPCGACWIPLPPQGGP